VKLNPLGMLLAALAGVSHNINAFAPVPQFRGATGSNPRKGWKAQLRLARPLRGYTAQYTHALSRVVQERQLRTIAQRGGATQFQLALLKELS